MAPKKPKRSAGKKAGAAVSGDSVASPMQGTIVKVAVDEGETVAEGDVIVVLEAMKMEQPLKAHKAGTVTGLKAEVGAGVTNGEVICEIKDAGVARAVAPIGRCTAGSDAGCRGDSSLCYVSHLSYSTLEVGMRGGEGDCCVVVVGAGAAGALTASHLVTGLSQRYRVVLVDPAPTTGRGTAYSTTDERHLLNVPASGMSAFPRDPEHFFRWVRRHHDAEAQPQDFVPRHVYGAYVESCSRPPRSTPATPGSSGASEPVLGHRTPRRPVRRTAGEREAFVARAVVLATGSRPGTDWAPAASPARRGSSPTRGPRTCPTATCSSSAPA